MACEPTATAYLPETSTHMTLTTIDPDSFPSTEDPLVLRTDYSNDEAWESIRRQIITPQLPDGFMAYVAFAEHPGLERRTEPQVIAASRKGYEHLIIFIVDSTTLHHPEHPILCLGLKSDEGKRVRVIPAEMWAIQNNLTIANMDFESFSESADHDGIYRGIR
jgi:hypothetical protein